MADRHTVQDYVRRYEMQMAPSSDADNPVQKGECASARAERRRGGMPCSFAARAAGLVYASTEPGVAPRDE